MWYKDSTKIAYKGLQINKKYKFKDQNKLQIRVHKVY